MKKAPFSRFCGEAGLFYGRLLKYMAIGDMMNIIGILYKKGMGMLKKIRKIFSLFSAAALMCGSLSLTGAAEKMTEPEESYAVIGWFQELGETVDKEIPAQGLAEVTLSAPVPLKIEGYAPADMALQFDMRITRTDGDTGTDSLKWVRNGWVKLTDSAGNERLKTASPTQSLTTDADRKAGDWMTVFLPLAPMTPEGGIRLSGLAIADYNDIPLNGADTGIRMEVRSARLLDLTHDTYGRDIPGTVQEARGQLKTEIDSKPHAGMSASAAAVYQTALSAAQTAYADNTATLPELRAAATALYLSNTAAEEDKTALRLLSDTGADETLTYTDESWSAYQSAQTLAQQALASPAVSRNEVDAAAEALRQAIDGLVIADVAVAYGDVDGKDGVIAADALLALQAATQKITLTGRAAMAADVDGIEGITANDALIILQYATKKITHLGPEPGNTEVVINETPLTFCNPLDLNYQYNYAPDVVREAADPAVVVFKGTYYLFASHNTGYWYSSDLAHWTYIQVDLALQPQFEKFAPATCVVGDTLYLTHSEGGNMLKTTDPKNPDGWEDIGKPANWGDPSMILDDDGFVYLYQGLSSDSPITAYKLDPNNNMNVVKGPVVCFSSHPDVYGFEVPGDSNTKYGNGCFLEGAWMVKHEGKYYLTYAVPGTEYATYADGCYVADNPMGPFTFCENSPVIWKSSGYMVGAGHGCLFEDLNGNWWKADTVSISVGHSFERRLALYPAVFEKAKDQDAYKSLYTNTVMSDYPMFIPTQAEDPFHNPGPGWNLLSYGKQAAASSELTAGRTAAKAFDESMRTWWSAATGDTGEWLQVDLGKLYDVWSVQVNFADQDTKNNAAVRTDDTYYRYLLEFSQDGEHWMTLTDRSRNTADRPHDYTEFTKAVNMRYLRITNKGAIPNGGKFALSGLRVFGEGCGKAPAAVTDYEFDRFAENERTISLSWDKAAGAQGYIIRFGTTPGHLYNQYQVIGKTSALLNCLNKGVDYYFTIDTYNENGVTRGETVHKAPWTEKVVIIDQVISELMEVEQEAGYTVYEAEESTFGNDADIGTQTPVNVANDAGASGGKTLHNLECTGAYFEFTGVDGGQGGDAVLRFGFANGNASAPLRLIVNGTDYGKFTLLGSGNWSTFKMVEIKVFDLKPGEANTIRFEAAGTGYNADWMQVIYTK